MTKHTIELETDGKYCGKDCPDTFSWPQSPQCPVFRWDSFNHWKLEKNKKGFIRCQACLNSEVKTGTMAPSLTVEDEPLRYVPKAGLGSIDLMGTYDPQSETSETKHQRR